MTGTFPDTAHLELAELTAHATGAVLDDVANAHLARCEDCRIEAGRWAAVADGVRHLVATSPPPRSFAEVLADTAAPATRGGRRRRHAVLASAAAAAVVLVGATAVIVGSTSGDGDSPTATMAGLTSTDCSYLKVAAGTVQRSGNSVALRTDSGALIPVRVTDSTQITRLTTVPYADADVTEDMEVFVRGQGDPSGTQVRAKQILPAPGSVEMPGLPTGLDVNITQSMATQGMAAGKVTDLDDAGFTVIGADGYSVRVSTTPSTTVGQQLRADVTELTERKLAVAVGTPKADGALHASAIQQNTLPEDLLWLPPNAQSDDVFDGLGCDATAIGIAALLAAGS